MRPVAVGRKNWIHVGSAKAGPKIVAILSVLETCRRMKLRGSDYLRAAYLDSLICPSMPRRTQPVGPAARNR